MSNHQSYLFFMAILKRQESNFKLSDYFEGNWELISKPKFSSSYYETEMGGNLIREFYVNSSQNFDFSNLAILKTRCGEIETKLADPSSNRTVNLDPGLIGLHQVVVSTFKNYSHRIPIGQNIYADLQLQYSKNTFEKLSWTYPDYEELIPDFNLARKILLKKRAPSERECSPSV